MNQGTWILNVYRLYLESTVSVIVLLFSSLNLVNIFELNVKEMSQKLWNQTLIAYICNI